MRKHEEKRCAEDYETLRHIDEYDIIKRSKDRTTDGKRKDMQ